MCRQNIQYRLFLYINSQLIAKYLKINCGLVDWWETVTQSWLFLQKAVSDEQGWGWGDWLFCSHVSAHLVIIVVLTLKPVNILKSYSPTSNSDDWRVGVGWLPSVDTGWFTGLDVTSIHTSDTTGTSHASDSSDSKNATHSGPTRR